MNRGNARLALLCVAQFVVVLDVTIVAIALPAIRRDLGFEPADLQWVLSAYTLTFGGGLLLAGRGQRARERRHGEDEQAAPERPAGAVEIRDPPGEQEPAAEGQRVRAEHPLQVGRLEPEVAPDGRQRDRHDRDVEDDDELRDAEERQACVTPIHGFGGNHRALRVNSALVVTRTIETIEFWGGDLALDFANTVEGDPPRIDHLRDYADLVTWTRRAGVLPANVRPEGDLATARELRDAIYVVFGAVAAGETPPRRALKTLLRTHAEAVGEGTLEDGAWAWSGRHPDRPLWPIAVAAVDLLRSDRLGRL